MLISPINQVTTFKGLWGATKENTHNEGDKHFYDYKYSYYPFSDETKTQIDKIVKDNTEHKEKTLGENHIGSPYQQITSTAVAVMAALPFTSKEFMHYTMNRLPITKQRLIERHIINKGLSVIKK